VTAGPAASPVHRSPAGGTCFGKAARRRFGASPERLAVAARGRLLLGVRLIDEATEQLLATWYGRLEPHALDAESEEDRQRYVDLDAWKGADGEVLALRGPAAVNKILGAIRLAARQRAAASTHLFAGFTGTGKTTELNRLTQALRDPAWSPGFTVLRVSAKQYHGMNGALSIEEMAVLLVAGIGEAALESLGEQALPKLKKGIWESVHERLRHLLDGHVTLKLGLLDIKPALFNGGTGLRDRLREALGERVHEKLRTFVHELVLDLALRISPRQLVVVVDDLEKYTVSTMNVASVYQQMADLFFLHGPLLRLPSCHTIYTVPPYLAFLNPGIMGTFANHVHLLPNIKVQGRPPEREPYSDGLEALTQMIAKRVDLDRLFGATRDACMRQVVLASGGHLRDLATLMRNIIEIGLDRYLPLGMREVEAAITRNSALRSNLLKDDLDVLLEVSKFGDLGPLEKSRLGAFAGVMDQHLMLCYWNGDFWYDAHPIVARKLQRARETSSPGEKSR
jgi:hypothetical protein